MKKFSLFFVFLLIVSSVPSFASKVIVNDDNDRIVYSRSTRPNDRIDETVYDSYLNSYNQKRNPELNIYQTNLLSKEFRTELAGKKWVKIKNTAKTPTNYDVKKYNRASREAADYFYVDKNNPHIKYSSGYNVK